MGLTEHLGRSARFTKRRALVGALRVKSSAWKIVQITVCAVGAYWIAEELLGHEGPLFAATSAMIALGFGHDTHLRRTLEVAGGCTLGILVGDLLVHAVGSGLWQAAVVVLISLIIARFLDSGTIFSTQLGLQSLLVVLLPAPDGGVFTRSADAVVGGLFALLIAVLTPRNPRHEPATQLESLLDEFAAVLRESATAVRTFDSTLAWHALVRARGTQKRVDELPVMLRGAKEIATMSPAYRGQRGELKRIARVAEQTDLAVRNARVIARRLAAAITHGAVGTADAEALSAYFDALADAITPLRASIAETSAAARSRAEHAARVELAACAAELDPREFGVTGLECESLVMILRPMTVDLLEAAGLDHEEARGYLPKL
ncbi:FUSC family protein [Kocuria polaris]|nr:FUSC family protein [Kocuria polaris]